jgi:hypothetical protein
MPNTQVQLPLEILQQVLHHVPSNDLLACLYVSHAWFIYAKRLFYRQIQFFRFSSIARFIKCMQFSPDHPNLLVQKIIFSFFVLRDRADVSIFEQQFRQLVALCPQVETLTSTQQLEDLVLKALYNLPTPLQKLSAFPYSFEIEYNACALLYSRTLTEYIMHNTGDKLPKVGFKELRNFTNLRKLSLLKAPLRTIQDVECVLNMCPLLQVLWVELRDDADEEHAIPQLPPLQQYPEIKSLYIHCPLQNIDCKLLYPFLHKCTNLERFKLVAINIEMATFKELEIFFNLIHSLPSVTLLFEGDDSNRTSEVALEYLQLIFHSRSKYAVTYIGIESDRYTHRSSDCYLHYIAKRSKRRELDIILPEFEANDPALHLAYVKTFAPYVNRLEINYELTDVLFNAGESFLHTVLSQCTALDSLTILHGTFLQALSPTINTSLHKLFLASCRVTSTFAESVSTACVDLRQLTLRNIEYSVMDPIIMPQTELQLLELNMSQFIESTQVLIRIRDSKWEWFFYTDFEKKLYMVPGKRQIPEGCQLVLLEFKSIQQLRVYNLDGYKDMTLKLN